MTDQRTYSEKLRDPRWNEFRQEAFYRHGLKCTSCGGNDTRSGDGLQIHHNRYFQNREPWEYDLDDVTVLCGTCHKAIHDCETLWRDMLRQMPAWALLEFKTMAEMVNGMKTDSKVAWAARCKNMAREIKGYRQIEK